MMNSKTELQAEFEAAKPGYGYAKLPDGRYLYEGIQAMFDDWLENNELRKAKLRITELESKLTGLEASNRALFEANKSLEAQLADAKQVANDCRIVADNAIAEALAAKKDAERLDWIIDNASSAGGGDGFTLKVFVPVDCECVRTAIDTVIQAGEV